jgi:hypothetical protein
MKNILLTLGAASLLASPSLFATEDSLQEHLRIEQKLKEQVQKRLKDGSGTKNQYKHQHQHKYQYKGTNPNRSNIGSMGGQKIVGGGRH